jgi:hypothetical protein
VAQPAAPHPGPGRRLRRGRLLRRRPAARHPRRLRRASAPVRQPRDPADDGPGGQPHLERAPLVPVGPVQPGLAVPGLVRLVADRAAARRGGRGLPRLPARHLVVRRGGGGLVPPPFLRLPAGPQLVQPRCPRGDRQGGRLLAAARGQRLPDGRGAVRDRGGAPGLRGPDHALRVAQRPARPHRLAARRRRRAGRGERPARAAAGVLRRARQPAAADVQLRREPADVPRAGPRLRDAGGYRDRGQPAAAGVLQLGHLPAQPRRGRPVRAAGERARGRLRAVRPGPGHAAVRPGHPAPAGDHARRRPAPDPARVCAAALAAGHPGDPVRRGDRDGRRPVAAAAGLDPDADAVGGRAAGRLHHRRRGGAADDRRGRLRLPRGQRAEPGGGPGVAAQLVRAGHPDAAGVPGVRLRHRRAARPAVRAGARGAVRRADRRHPGGPEPRRVRLHAGPVRPGRGGRGLPGRRPRRPGVPGGAGRPRRDRAGRPGLPLVRTVGA